jgi:NADH dehydrogenase
MLRNVLVLGGSGFVGRSVCEHLVRRLGAGSGRIVVPSRRPARAKHLQLLPTVEVVQADVNDPAQLARLVAGMDAVVNLVAILQGSEAAFQRAHVDLPKSIAAACRAAGVRRIVHVSALGVAKSAPSAYLRSKAAGEEALAGAGLDVTLLRPSLIFGADDRTTNLFATLQAVAPFVPLAGADAKLQPVWVEDVARAVVHCLDDPTTIGRTYECAGPQVLTLRELVQRCGTWSGRPRRVFALPGAVAALQATLFELLPGEPLISRDNLASLTVPNVATPGRPGLAELGITAASMDAVVPGYLGHAAGPARLDPYRSRARRF